MIANLNERTHFQHRQNGPSQKDISEMLDVVGVNSVDDLIDSTVNRVSGINLEQFKKLRLQADIQRRSDGQSPPLYELVNEYF